LCPTIQTATARKAKVKRQKAKREDERKAYSHPPFIENRAAFINDD
jgi:hypothetical protein